MSHHIEHGHLQPARIFEREIAPACLHFGAVCLWLAAVYVSKDYFGSVSASSEVLSPIAVLYLYATVIVCRYGWAALSVVHAFWLVAIIRSVTILGKTDFLAALLFFGVGLITIGLYARRELVCRYHH